MPAEATQASRRSEHRKRCKATRKWRLDYRRISREKSLIVIVPVFELLWIIECEVIKMGR